MSAKCGASAPEQPVATRRGRRRKSKSAPRRSLSCLAQSAECQPKPRAWAGLMRLPAGLAMCRGPSEGSLMWNSSASAAMASSLWPTAVAA